MNKVHVLPEELISKIAAGEVIERPASVIKEVVENSLDAGATSIEISLKDAGKTSIVVKDNGCGMGKDDLEKIFFRHATSKIANADDLYNIQSLGFRGEALYSIASIADVTLKTKTNNQAEAWETHLRGGKRLDLRPAALATSGTQIEINELFFNTPARKKFLKANTAEINQILNIFVPYTLLYPQHRFRLTHQGRDLIDLAPAKNFKDRISDTLHLDKNHLIETNAQTSSAKIQLILGDINIKRTRRDMQFIFVNHRPVQNKNILYHLNQIYRLILAPDEFPFFVVFIEIPADEVDVNIHPTKREVKIKSENELCSLLRVTVEQALMKQGNLKSVVSPTSYQPAFSGKNPAERALTSAGRFDSHFDSSVLAEPSKTPQEDYAFPREAQQQEFFVSEKNVGARHAVPLLESARYVGPFLNKFLLFESDHSLIVIDQHAAAERVTYEKIIGQMKNNTLEVQNLLSPVLIKTTAQEMLTWEESKEDFEKMGFSSSQWDSETIAIHTHPQLLNDTEKAVRYLLAGETVAKCDHDTLARRACRSSVMAGDYLNPQKAQFLQKELLKCLDPFTCPHGRPTIIEITESFLDKQFLRT